MVAASGRQLTVITHGAELIEMPNWEQYSLDDPYPLGLFSWNSYSKRNQKPFTSIVCVSASRRCGDRCDINWLTAKRMDERYPHRLIIVRP